MVSLPAPVPRRDIIPETRSVSYLNSRRIITYVLKKRFICWLSTVLCLPNSMLYYHILISVANTSKTQ